MAFHSRDSFCTKEYREVSFGRGKDRRTYIVSELEAECVRLGEMNTVSVAYMPVKKVVVDMKNPTLLRKISEVLRIADNIEHR
jgi:hypothetical protein